MDDADCGQAIDGFHRIDAMAAGNGNVGLCANRLAAAQDVADDLRWQHIDRHPDDGERQNRHAPHGIDVRQGVGGGNAAKIEWIIHDRHEKVGRRDDRLLVIEPIDGRVVRGLCPNQQLRESPGRSGSLEQIGQHVRSDLAAAAAAVGQRGQPRRDGGSAVHDRILSGFARESRVRRHMKEVS